MEDKEGLLARTITIQDKIRPFHFWIANVTHALGIYFLSIHVSFAAGLFVSFKEATKSDETIILCDLCSSYTN